MTLSHREVHIALLLADGESITSIPAILHTSVNTVTVAIKKMAKGFGVANPSDPADWRPFTIALRASLTGALPEATPLHAQAMRLIGMDLSFAQVAEYLNTPLQTVFDALAPGHRYYLRSIAHGSGVSWRSSDALNAYLKRTDPMANPAF